MAVKKAKIEGLLSPKVKEILQLIVYIRQTCPGEKINISSYFLKFQDIIKEAILQANNSRETVHTIQIDGSINSKIATERQKAFEDADNDTVLLLTGVGAHGVNLHCASKIIQAEPRWNTNE